jgi:hypothetical protein
MFRAGAGLASRFDFAAFRCVSLDVDGFIDAKPANFAAGASEFILSSAAGRAGVAMTIVVISWHFIFLEYL